MTTVRKLQAQVSRLLEKGPRTRDSKLSPAYVQELIRQSAHKLLKAEHYQNMNDGERTVNPLVIATYTATVLNDSTRHRNYVATPGYPMNLPETHGIFQVRPLTGQVAVDKAMIPLDPFELEMFSSSSAGAEVFKDQFMFEPDRDKIWFTENNGVTLLNFTPAITTVEIRQALIDPTQVDENDNFPVPPEMETDIIRDVLSYHGYTGGEIHDMINDGNPNTK